MSVVLTQPSKPPHSHEAPTFIPPMLALPVQQLPRQPRLSYEFKWDGMRAFIRVASGTLCIRSRSGEDITLRFPEFTFLSNVLASHEPVILDGEIVSLDARQRPSFSLLQRRMHVQSPSRAKQLATQQPATLLAFDLLWQHGQSLLGERYLKRREMLEALPLRDQRCWVPPRSSDGQATLASAKQLELEGVIAKRDDSLYEPGLRSGAWSKLRLYDEEDFTIVGWVPQRSGSPASIGALLLACTREGKLHYAGKVGSGLSDHEQHSLLRELEPLRIPASAIAGTPHGHEIRHVQPRLVARVRFHGWTHHDTLRQPSFITLHRDPAA